MSNSDFSSNIECSECSNIKMLGINFEYQNKNLEKLTQIYSLCPFKQSKNKNLIQKISLDDLFSKMNENNIYCESNIKCEFCNKLPFQYHCIECRRNICINCFGYHKTHKYYYDKDYISEKELENIKNNLNKSKSVAKMNSDNIEKYIKNFETQLNELKNLYEKFKDINNKLFIFSEYILDQYIKLVKAGKSISFPLYFNIKNVLLFNPHKLNLPENDISIKSFTEILNAKLCSGYYYILSNSYLSDNLYNYNKLGDNLINFNIMDINKFNKKELLYDKIKYFSDNKIFGITYNLSDNSSIEEKEEKIGTEIYNIKNNNVEALIIESPENIFYSKEYKLLILVSDLILKIMNPINFHIITTISANHKLKKETKKKRYTMWGRSDSDSIDEDTICKFLHIEFLNKNYVGVIFDGNIKYLGEKYGDFYDTEYLKIINEESKCYSKNRYGDYIHFILYENKNGEFVPQRVIPLVKKNITEADISYITGKHCEELYEYKTYCIFYLDSVNKISEEELIIAFKSRIKIERDQYYHFIDERNYKNETNYYLLNFKKDETIKKKIGSTKEKSFLFKSEDENNFYFFYDKTELCAKNLEKVFINKNLKLTTVQVNDKLDVRNIVIKKNIVIGWNKNCVYLGIIYNNILEIIQEYEMDKGKYIKYISLVNNYIFYNDRKDKDESELKEEDKFIEEELYPKKKDEYSNEKSEEEDED